MQLQLAHKVVISQRKPYGTQSRDNYKEMSIENRAYNRNKNNARKYSNEN